MVNPQILELGSVFDFGKFDVGQFDFQLIPLENNFKTKVPFEGFTPYYRVRP